MVACAFSEVYQTGAIGVDQEHLTVSGPVGCECEKAAIRRPGWFRVDFPWAVGEASQACTVGLDHVNVGVSVLKGPVALEGYESAIGRPGRPLVIDLGCR